MEPLHGAYSLPSRRGESRADSGRAVMVGGSGVRPGGVLSRTADQAGHGDDRVGEIEVGIDDGDATLVALRRTVKRFCQA
jgi:hypothetical protein